MTVPASFRAAVARQHITLCSPTAGAEGAICAAEKGVLDAFRFNQERKSLSMSGSAMGAGQR